VSDERGRTTPGGDTGPPFRLWPPVAVGAPLVTGCLVSSWVGDPLYVSSLTSTAGWLLVIVFAFWNGWALITMGRHRTGLLPGAPSITVIETGPFAWSRNPLYVGLLVASLGIALLAGSTYALLALPLEWGLLRWGAVLPEERYLSGKFGSSYDGYRARVRRWL
jgi:protein-S-isoprenylcysteine O-methyltransferase Ste14